MIQRSNHDAYPDSGSTIRFSKRKRENDAAIEELSRLEMEAKKRRVLPREEPNVGDDMGEPEVDFNILMRKHSVSLHQGLRTYWTCVSEVLGLERETFIAPTEEELSDGDVLRSALWRTITTCNHIAGSQDHGQVSL